MANKLTKITATQLQKQSGQIIRRAFDGEQFVIVRGGYPMVVVLALSHYEKLIAPIRPQEKTTSSP